MCPPHAASEVAEAVIAASFQGIYVDANAISPMRASDIDSKLRQAGIDAVDGGIIGGPAWTADSTTLYLSGKRAAEISACFSGGHLRCRILGPEIGKASAVKCATPPTARAARRLLPGFSAWPKN